MTTEPEPRTVVVGVEGGGSGCRTAIKMAAQEARYRATSLINAQLIVLAGRGSTSMLLGTVSQYVLRKAPCPVLVVPDTSREG
jgi:nucleotide-binding universal stress UspA family protein